MRDKWDIKVRSVQFFVGFCLTYHIFFTRITQHQTPLLNNLLDHKTNILS